MDKICMCKCHEKGVIIRHIAPCCRYTYIQYINKDGSIDYDIYNSLIKNLSK